jgi:CheY-like chemotaxis protein
MGPIEHAVLIDDNEVTNFYNQDILSMVDPSLKVTIFNSATEALAFFERGAFGPDSGRTLVLLDIKMPGLTGFDLLRELDDLDLMPENFVFCILSSSTQVRDQEELQKFPLIQRYLEKPLNAEKLEDLLNHFNAPKK